MTSPGPTENDEVRPVLDLLVDLRVESGLSQREVGRRMGVAQSTVAAFERESNDPHLSTLQRYARAIGAVLVCSVEPVVVEGSAARSGDDGRSDQQAL